MSRRLGRGSTGGYVFARWPGRATDLSEHGAALGCAELADLFVAADARRRGVGRMLVEAVEALVARTGYAVLGLEVTAANPDNAAARSLYALLGYEDAGIGEFVSGYTF